MSVPVADLVILVSDNNMQAAVRGLLSRPDSLGIRKLKFNIFVHPERDPGCLHRGHDFLQPLSGQYYHAIMMFDRVGCGQDNQTKDFLEKSVNDRLANVNWGSRATTIVIEPELEIWIWSDSPEVPRCLGWIGQEINLRAWLEDHGLWPWDQLKPNDPKRALESALRYLQKPRSSSLYEQIARTVSIQRCVDPAFAQFKMILTNWFGKNKN